jgi:hypothetical protein
LGKLKDGDGAMVTQSVRFSKKRGWDLEKAKAWIKDHPEITKTANDATASPTPSTGDKVPFEIVAPLVMEMGAENELPRTVGAVVYAPNRVDTWGTYMVESEIVKMAHRFMKLYAKGQAGFDLYHSGVPGAADLIESYIISDNTDRRFPERKGAWAVVSELDDEVVRQRIKDKEINAYSMAGVAEVGEPHEVRLVMPDDIAEIMYGNWVDIELVGDPPLERALALAGDHDKRKKMHLYRVMVRELKNAYTNFISFVPEGANMERHFPVEKRVGGLFSTSRSSEIQNSVGMQTTRKNSKHQEDVVMDESKVLELLKTWKDELGTTLDQKLTTLTEGLTSKVTDLEKGLTAQQTATAEVQTQLEAITKTAAVDAQPTPPDPQKDGNTTEIDTQALLRVLRDMHTTLQGFSDMPAVAKELVSFRDILQKALSMSTVSSSSGSVPDDQGDANSGVDFRRLIAGTSGRQNLKG